ncbi:MAG TPA: class I SAM-dependent methyltransferase [Steroidobacteraceae bacterium]|jgi:SAM-dependent methyltransferase|nr:class I SAM-dependent methyltransferase [Steroidobacteraceae bacterium]
MKKSNPPPSSERELLETNRRFYDLFWRGADLVEPQRFNTWPLVESLLSGNERRLEVAPGLRPRLPIGGTQFLDISTSALAPLRSRGAQVVQGQITAMPFADQSFDLVCALDIIEHVDDDARALEELARVTRAGGTILLSTPLHQARWTNFDEFVGHKRRYEPEQLLDRLAQHGLEIERSAVFGMQPRSSRLLDLGIWWLVNQRERAMWWYNRAFAHVSLRLQKPLRLSIGLIGTDGVDEVLLVVRRGAPLQLRTQEPRRCPRIP